MGAIAVASLVAACTGDDGGPAAGSGREPTSSSSATVASPPGSQPDTNTGPVAPDGDAAPTLPGVPGEVADPAPIDGVGQFGNGVTVRLADIEAVDAEAVLPGEFSGPAVAVTVEVTNGASQPITLDAVTVDLANRDGVSASPVSDPDRAPLSGDLPAGDSRSGSYVFSLERDQRTDVTVRISYSADVPTVVLQGSIP